MIGLGTNLKSPFGWKCDATTGEPEVYYWQGTVRHYQYEWSNPPNWVLNWTWEPDGTKSNKLYKLTFDHNNRTVGRELVWDAKDVFVNSSADKSKTFGNLEFISRDTFVITEEWSPEDPGGALTNTYRKVILWGNKIDDAGVVTPKVWKRVLLEDWVDIGSNDADNQFDYPGQVLGVSSIPPMGSMYDNNSVWKNLLVMTTPGFYGPPWSNVTENFHERYILRLETDDEDITNPDYMADPGAWNGNPNQSAGNPGSFRFENIVGSEGRHGAEEGYFTVASDQSALYGTVQGYNWGCFEQGTMGYWSQSAGGTGIYWNKCNGRFENKLSNAEIIADRVYFHDVGLIPGLQWPIEEIAAANSGNHMVCKIDAGYTYDFEDGIRWNFNISDNTTYGNNGAGGAGTPETPWGAYFYYWNNNTFADSACTDWFGETKWGREYGKDVVLMHVPRNHARTIFRPDDGWGNAFTTNREGILVVKRDPGTNNIVLLDNDDFSRDNGLVHTDRNGYRRVTYAFDSSWGTIYNSPCCEDSSGNCQGLPVGGGLSQNDCSNGPTWLGSKWDWDNWSDSSVSEANSGDSNGNIPTLRGQNQPWSVQDFYTSYSGGMSFRPNWLV